MTTKFVGIKEFRQNIAGLTASSKKKNQRLIILNRNTPIFEVRPISDTDFTAENFALGIERGLADMKAGRVYTQAQIESMFGL